jgi:hypothetical protein
MAETTGVAKRSAAITSLTDSSGGTASNALAAGVGKIMLPFFIDLPTLADGDVLTTFTPGFAGEVVAVDFHVHAAVTTAAKASTLNLEIGTTNLTGGAVALTSANCTPAGAEVNGTAVTAANTFTATDTISIEAASTTTFIEGSGWLIVTVRNLDTVNAIASLAAKANSILTNLRDADVIRV